MTDKETPKISPSIAKKLLDGTPLNAWCNHRLLGNMAKPMTDGQVAGILTHATVLGHDERLAILPYDSFRSNEAKEAKQAAIDAGLIPVAQPKWDEASENAPHIIAALSGAGVILDGTVEHRFNWVEDGVLCTGVVDHWDGKLMVDEIKTGPSLPTREYCERHLIQSHSHLQDAAYRRAVAAELDVDPVEVTVRFAFVQSVAPFAVNIRPMTAAFREYSEIRWTRAVKTWGECLASGVWPGPNDEDYPFDVPVWALKREMELEAFDDE